LAEIRRARRNSGRRTPAEQKHPVR
jgi:hypothetical protein